MEGYKKKLKTRLLAYRLLIFALFAVMIFIGELSNRGRLLDSRGMTPLAQTVSRIVAFGGVILLGALIWHTKRLLNDGPSFVRQKALEEDERRRLIRDRSGAAAMDGFLAVAMATVFALSWVDMAAFNTALGLLAAALLLKGAAWLYYARRF